MAQFGPWVAEGDLSNMTGTAQRVAVLDEFYMTHGARFRLTLELGNRELTGECPSAAVDGQTLQFHWRRERQ